MGEDTGPGARGLWELLSGAELAIVTGGRAGPGETGTVGTGEPASPGALGTAEIGGAEMDR
jgi:hypothetical protein